MSEIERIWRYIADTPVYARSRFDMSFAEAVKIKEIGGLDAVSLAFNYGQAKGYRAAKSESREGAAV